MPKVIRVQLDDAQYHGYSPLGRVVTGSNDVITNGAPTARETDPYTPAVHCAPGPVCHGMGLAAEGSPDVFVNGLPIHRDGDRIDCGTVADNGSPDVFANGGPGSESSFLGDGGFDDDYDFIGYVPGDPIVEYLDSEGSPILVCSGNFTITPFDGFRNSGYVNVHQEDNASPGSRGAVVARTYPEVGVFPPDPDIPEFFNDSSPQLTYELEVINDNIQASIDVNTGIITGYSNETGSIKVRASHHYFDDNGDSNPGTQGPWWTIQIEDCT